MGLTFHSPPASPQSWHGGPGSSCPTPMTTVSRLGGGQCGRQGDAVLDQPPPPKQPLSQGGGKGRRLEGDRPGGMGWGAGCGSGQKSQGHLPPSQPGAAKAVCPCTGVRAQRRTAPTFKPSPYGSCRAWTSPCTQASPQSSAQRLQWLRTWPPSPCPPWPQAPPDAHPGSWASAPGEEGTEESEGRTPHRSLGEAGAAAGRVVGALSPPCVLCTRALVRPKRKGGAEKLGT